MKHLKTYEGFNKPRLKKATNLYEKFVDLKKEVENFERNVQLGLNIDGAFEQFQRYVSKFISIYNKMIKIGMSQDVLYECYSFIYEKTEAYEKMPYIHPWSKDRVKKIYQFLNDHCQEHNLPDRPFYELTFSTG